MHFFRVADVVYKLTAEGRMQREPGNCLQPYLIEPEQRHDVHIHVHESLPGDLSFLNDLPSICDGNLDGQSLWSVAKHEEGFVIRTYQHFSPDDQQFVTVTDKHFTRFACYPLNFPPEDEQRSVAPVSFPLLSLILYYQTLSHPMLFVHASAVCDGDKGRVFTGVSGVGKSTISNTWYQAGYKLINDDRLLIRKNEEGRWIVHNTPMVYPQVPASVPLHAVYLLRQAPEYSLRKLRSAEAVTRVLSNCILQGFDRDFLQHHLRTVTDMLSETPVYEFGNLPEPGVIDFIREHEAHRQ
ncbi:hypothetical protein CYPRO_3247 [Cyclonatronum proteinivorum]|uniref:Hpr(Ser) kinase/phosphatase n=1 Tax=Cyclonatronum proteinivorum TaxID=1457365 RepID=A0A345UPS8_9BACT|nr:hypothetical protein [Cyclonatronum proteinivorum]AXJ02480.1 hypothetical protein CYPRO_3247 [Cyclonatronum proteinivorum]